LHRACAYATSGFTQSGGFLRTVEAYSLAANVWAMLPFMPTARNAPAVVTAPCPGVFHRACVYAISGFIRHQGLQR
jgi:hypothetical protein